VRYIGAGIYANQNNNSLEVKNCVFHDNKHSEYQLYGNEGLSIWCYASAGKSITVERCEFYDEDFPSKELRANCAVAIYSDFDGAAYFKNNKIHNCDDNINAIVNIYGLDYAEIDDNVFYDNIGGSPPLSVRVCNEGYIRNNLFYNNRCEDIYSIYSGSGGAMWLAATFNTDTLHVLGNTMVDNFATFKGAAIYCSYFNGGIIRMHNNICWKNETYNPTKSDDSEIHLAFHLGGGTAYVTDCNVENGEEAIKVSGIGGGDYEIENIFNWDPVFIDEGKYNLHLSPGSPCIDAGLNNCTGEPRYDFEGDYRIMKGDCSHEPVIDIGADEYKIGGLTLKYMTP